MLIGEKRSQVDSVWKHLRSGSAASIRSMIGQVTESVGRKANSGPGNAQ